MRGPPWKTLLLAIVVAGCIAPPTENAANPPAPPQPPLDQSRVISESFHGTLVALPVAPAAADHPVNVPDDGSGLSAMLTWTNPGTTLRLSLMGPSGRVDATDAVAGTTARHAFARAPAGGAWTVHVQSDRAANEAYDVVVRIAVGGAAPNGLAGTLTVAPNVFAEANLEMKANARFDFAWKTIGGEPLTFDVHTHRDGQVRQFYAGSYSELSGNFTTTDDGGASLLWQNDGATPVQFRYAVEGDFVLGDVFG